MGKKKRAKARIQGKRRQKTALKAQRRVAGRHKTQPPTRAQLIRRDFPDEDWIFWVAHGANYLVSNYQEGTWTPLFEGIYEGTLPAPEEIARIILDKFGSVEAEAMPLEGKAALAWSVQSREAIYVYYREALRRLQEKDPTADAEALCRAPHNGTVWGLFEFIKEKVARKP